MPSQHQLPCGTVLKVKVTPCTTLYSSNICLNIQILWLWKLSSVIACHTFMLISMWTWQPAKYWKEKQTFPSNISSVELGTRNVKWFNMCSKKMLFLFVESTPMWIWRPNYFTEVIRWLITVSNQPDQDYNHVDLDILDTSRYFCSMWKQQLKQPSFLPMLEKNI